MNLLFFLFCVFTIFRVSVSDVPDVQEYVPPFVDDNTITRNDPLSVLNAYQYNYYMDFAAIVTRVHLLQQQYPDKITMKIVGYSRENRPIVLVIITDKETSPDIEENVILETTDPIPTDLVIDGSDTVVDSSGSLVPDNMTLNYRLPDFIHTRDGERKLRMDGTDATASVTEKPVIFMDAGIHAREWVAPAAALYVIDKLLQTPHLTNLLEWRIIPMVNPDGYEYSRVRSRLWRKNRAKTYSARCRGVDLNRNFPVQFHRTSRIPCSETYGGASPFSEPETRAIRDAVTEVARRTQAYVTLHTYGQLILHPYGYTKSSKPPTVGKLVQMGNGMAGAIYAKYKNSYRVRQASILGAAAGGSDDWAYINMKIPYSYTFELQDRVNVRYEFTTRGFVLSPSRLPQAVDECWLAMQYMGNQIIRELGLQIRVKPIDFIHAAQDESEIHVIPVHETSSSEEDSGELLYPIGWEQVIKEVQRVRMEVAETSHINFREDCVKRGNMYVCPHMVFWGSMYNEDSDT